MRLFNFCFLCIVFLFSSCAKEADFFSGESNLVESVIQDRSTVVEIEVSEISWSTSANELYVDFTSTHDFSDSVLENNQSLKFSGSGNIYTLNFSVDSYSGANGELEVTFSIGLNNLLGLQLLEEQEIGIEDEVVN